MKTRRVSFVLLLAAATPSFAAAQAAATGPQQAAPLAPVVAIGQTDAAPEDRWQPTATTVPQHATVNAALREVASDASLEPAPKRPALTFADQQPLKPNLFDAPTAWEDRP